MIKHLSNSKLRGLVLIVLSMLISACEGVALAAPANLDPCPPEKNPYTNPIDRFLVEDYEHAVASMSDIGTYNSYQQQAFYKLVNRVYDWTDSVVINTGEKKIEIAITYLGPEVAQSVVINHYLYKRNNNFTGRLDEQVQSHLEGIIRRNEHIFFITFITPPSNNAVTIESPLSGLELTNTNNLTVRKGHSDHNLERSILLQNGGELDYGFVFFPIAVLKDGNCQTVLDEKRDTSMVISVPSLNINGTDYGAQSWRYKFSPLIDLSSLSDTYKGVLSLNQPVDQITPAKGSLSPGGKDDPSYWITLARIIWLETTLDP